MPKIVLTAQAFPVPFDKLRPDPDNVRRTGAMVEIPELAESIAREGLLQNLGVRPMLDGKGEATDCYLVSVGGRRLAALTLLVKAKRLAKTAPISCAPVADDAVTSAGAAENLHRLPMHPADAWVAFARMHDEGKTENEIAVRFGVTVQTVQKRMRLGRLSAKVLDALRANAITEQVAQAFALTTDHEAQDRVFDRLTAERCVYPHVIRSALTEGEVEMRDRRVAFVGLGAYEAAGGEVRRDLFSDDHHSATLTDPALLDSLVMARLEAEGERLRVEGWPNVCVSLMAPDELRAYYTAPFEMVPLSDEAEATLAALAEESDELAAKSEGEGLTEQEDARYDEIAGEVDAIQAQTSRYSDETKAAGKAFVYLDWRGMTVAHSLPRALPAPAARVVGRDDEDQAEAEDVPVARAVASTRPELTATLAGELYAQRTAALQAQVAARPDLALRLVVQSLILGRGYGAHYAVAKITGSTPHLRLAAPGIEDTVAARALAAMHERRGDHEPGDHDAVLPWLLMLNDGEVLDILAPLVASTVDAGHQDWSQASKDSLPAQVARAAELDMTAYWSATVESYFEHVSKAQIAAAVMDAGVGPFSADGKKAEIAAVAARLIHGTGWLPGVLRSPPARNDNAALPAVAEAAMPEQLAAE